jgi:hypothetical protein
MNGGPRPSRSIGSWACQVTLSVCTAELVACASKTADSETRRPPEPDTVANAGPGPAAPGDAGGTSLERGGASSRAVRVPVECDPGEPVQQEALCPADR